MKKPATQKVSRKKRQPSIFSENLRKISSRRNLSTRVLASMAGVQQSVINGWLNGAAPTNLEKVAQLAKGLGCTFSWLVLGKDESQSIDDLPLEELLVEDETQTFSGVFRLQATRLVRPKKKGLL